MRQIKINFLEDDARIITSLVIKISTLLNLDTIINKGLTTEEWSLLRKLLESGYFLLQDTEENPISIESVIKKIDLAIKEH